MGWSTVYLILAILAGIVGIWNLARQRNVFLSLTGIVWFLLVLFQFYIPSVYGYRFTSSMPEIGTLVLYVLIPVFLVLSYFTQTRK